VLVLLAQVHEALALQGLGTEGEGPRGSRFQQAAGCIRFAKVKKARSAQHF
jgi:hypothetical protein